MNSYFLGSNQNIIKIAIVLMAIDSSFQNFCDHFESNNYSIDYQYDHQMKGDEVIHLLIIGHKYWTISHYLELTHFDSELIIIDMEEGVSDWLGSLYKSGFSIRSKTDETFITGLLRNDVSGKLSFPFNSIVS